MNPSQTDIPLTEAVARIRRDWRRIALYAVIGALLGAVFAFTSRRIYVSEILMLPINQNAQGGVGGIAKQLSGLASMTGISLGGIQGNDSRDTSIATLSSYQTLSTFLSTEGIQQTVLTEAGADREHQTTWRAVREFQKHLTISQEKTSNLVKLSIEWYDPQSASAWTNHLVALADAKLRAQALDTARGRIAFLEKELLSNQIVAVREVISGMMENELRTLATADADKEFAFRIIDPAIPAETPARPHRLLITAAFGCCGLLLGCIFAVLSDRSRVTARRTTRAEPAN